MFSKKMIKSKSDKSIKETAVDEEEQKMKRNGSEQMVIEITAPEEEELHQKHRKKSLVRGNTKNKRISIKSDKTKEDENNTRDDGKPQF